MIPDFDAESISDIKQRLARRAKITIVMHYKPDGDAMGAALALHDFLKTLGHQSKVISPSDYPDFLKWMPGEKEIINYETQATEAQMCLQEAEVIFILDFNDARRVEKMEAALTSSPAFKILIDHHLEPTAFCDVSFSFTEASSTCELIFHFAKAIKPGYEPSLHFAETIYAGIMTDTGSFRYSSTTGDVHRIVAHLLDAGVVPDKIHELIYDSFSANRTHLLGFCLLQKLKVLAEYNVAFISISRKELYQYQYETGDTEGIVNFALGIKNIRMAAFIAEHENVIKLSFRSKGSFSVKEIASKHFNGGGHRNAAGGKSFTSLDDTVTKFLALLPFYKSELTT